VVFAVIVPAVLEAEHDRVVPTFGPSILTVLAQSVLSAPVTDQRSLT
jgi:hypothetical protein